jgi:Tol biopolymer transport system component
MHKFAFTISLIALVLIGAAGARAATLQTDSTVILSGTPSLLAPLPAPVGFSVGGPNSVDQTGRFVAFASQSDALSAEDNDGVDNVYVKDRVTGAVTLVSRGSGANGAPATQNCDDPAISDNGNRVAFTCDGPLDAADDNDVQDVYVRDLTTNETILVSRATALGTAGDGDSDSPALSEDGSVVTFESEANNLGGTTDDSTQIYRRVISATPAANVTLLVSRGDGAAGKLPDASSQLPSISDDGDRVAFQSNASNLVADTVQPVTNVYVRQVSTGKTLLESRAAGPNGAPVNGDTTHVQISGDGAVVVFQTTATNLNTVLDTTRDLDVYERVIADGALGIADKVGAKKANGDAFYPAVDDTGATVSFLSSATNLDPTDTDPGGDVYVVHGGTVAVASRRNGQLGSPGNLSSQIAGQSAVSGNGNDVLFSTYGSVVNDLIPGVYTISMRDLSTNTTSSVATPAGAVSFNNVGGPAEAPVLSADGRYAAFTSSAPELGIPGNIAEGVVVRDTVTGFPFLASRADGERGAPFDDAFDPSISANGRRVAFVADGNVWVRDLLDNTTTLVSRATGAGGAAGNDSSFDPSISADGNRVEFESLATNLGDGDTDAKTDAHVRDLKAGTTVLASRADGADGLKANSDTTDSALSADGTHVVFSTQATNLGDGDTDQTEDVHIRDLAKGTTRLVSVPIGGTKEPATEAAVNADGTRVAYAATFQVFVRDLVAGKTILASRADGASGAPGDKRSDEPALSADGNIVAFRSAAENFSPSTGAFAVYRRDLDASTTRLVSGGSDVGFAGGITANGACVGFQGDGNLLGPAPGALDYLQAYLHAFQADCGGRSAKPFTTDTDKTAPVLRSVKLTHKKFRVAKGRTALAARRKPRIARGTVLRFTSSEASRLSVVVERVQKARRKGRKVLRTRKVATLTRTIKAGAGRVSFTGRLGKRRLAAGTYRLTLTARDSAGNVSKPVSLTFTIVAG